MTASLQLANPTSTSTIIESIQMANNDIICILVKEIDDSCLQN